MGQPCAHPFPAPPKFRWELHPACNGFWIGGSHMETMRVKGVWVCPATANLLVRNGDCAPDAFNFVQSEVDTE